MVPLAKFILPPFKKKPKRTLIYLSGQITGIEERAFDIFESAEKQLLSNGYAVVNPMKLPHRHDKTWESYMREDIEALVKCDAIFMLPNWHASRGAKIEYSLAYSMGLKVMMQSDLN